jgi:hypothetical protein
MNELIEQQISCPYCGEVIDLLVDGSVPQQSYIEDCPVCCRPMNVDVSVSPDGAVVMDVSRVDE